MQVFNGATLLGTATVVAGNWSLDTTLAAGTYNNLKVTVTDLAGNASTTTTAQTIIVDSAAPTESFPTVTLTSDTGTSNSDFITSNGGVHFAGAVADTGGAGIGSVQVFNGATLLGTATVVAGNWSLDTTLAAGTYNNLKVTVTDLAGNASTTTTAQTIIVDSTPPSVAATVTALSADTGTAGDFITSVASQTVSGTFTGTLGAGEKIQVSADGGTTWVDATAGSGTWSASGVTLLAGTGALSVRTIDTANNTTAGSGHSFTLDTVAPTAPGVALTNDTGSSSSDHITSNPALTLTNIESGAKVEYSHDAGTTWSTSAPTAAQLVQGAEHHRCAADRCGRQRFGAHRLHLHPRYGCRRRLRSRPRLRATILSTRRRRRPALPSTAPPRGLPTGRRQRLCWSTAPTPWSTPTPRSSAAMPGPSPSRRRRRKRWPMAAIRSKPMCRMWPATRRAKRARR